MVCLISLSLSLDELTDLNKDRANICFYHYGIRGWGLRSRNASLKKKGKRKVQGVPQSQAVAHLRHEEEDETDKSKLVQIEQTYEKH